MTRCFARGGGRTPSGTGKVGDEEFERLVIAHGAGPIVTVVLDGEVAVQDPTQGGVGGGLVVASGLVGGAAGDEGVSAEGLANIVFAAALIEQFTGDGDHANLAGDHVEDALGGFAGLSKGGQRLHGLGGAPFGDGIDELEDVGFVVDGGEGFDDGFVDGGVAGVDLDLLQFGGERPEVMADAGDEQTFGAGGEVKAEGAGAVVEPGFDVALAEGREFPHVAGLGDHFANGVAVGGFAVDEDEEGGVGQGLEQIEQAVPGGNVGAAATGAGGEAVAEAVDADEAVVGEEGDGHGGGFELGEFEGLAVEGDGVGGEGAVGVVAGTESVVGLLAGEAVFAGEELDHGVAWRRPARWGREPMW